jgi:glycosyltransferase involved in cell wall biosynthesis
VDDANWSILLWGAVGLYGVVVIGWWARHVFISLMRPLGLVAHPRQVLDGTSRISVVIPARDEANRIGPCLESLIEQGAAVAEVIVVDDRSEDATAEVVAEFAERDDRLRVVRVDHLPRGWLGKAHACHVGAKAASSDWLLFTDADCRFFAGGLAGAVAHAEEHGTDLLTLWPRADHQSFWEHMLIPTCGAIIAYWFANLRVNNPRSKVAFANGQFMLFRREAYERIGGHRCAAGTVIEDVPLAQHAKRNGVRLRSVLGCDIFTVRMYAGFDEIWSGWTRIFIGALQRPWRLLVSAWSLIGGSVFPSVAAPVLAIIVATRALPDSPQWSALSILVWLHFIGVYTVSFRFWGLGLCNRRHLLLYPVSAAMVAAILLRAWWWMVTAKPIIWRGSPTGPHGDKGSGEPVASHGT